LLLEPVIERLEVFYSSMIGICWTLNGPVVALTEPRSGRKSHGVACCRGKLVGSVVAFFVVGKVIVLGVVVDVNGRQVRCDEIPQGVHCLRERAKRGSHVNQSLREHLRFVNGPRGRKREFSGKLKGIFGSECDGRG
jgi:hypothetical protein